MVTFEHLIEFSWYDYTLFALMLGISTSIGIYFGFFSKKKQNAEEYLLGSSEMTVFPVSMSLISSYISGITLLAVPADTYLFGTNYGTICLSLIVFGLLAYYVYLPVFYKIKITSIYEYLEMRFDKRNRVVASLLYSVSVLFFLPIVIYIPALACSQATGFNVHILTPIICGVCIFYTTVGGLKAVVWTDTLQFTAMIGGIIAVIIIGIEKIGGVANLFAYSIDGDRFFPDFDISLFRRDTFWSCFIGMVAHCATILCNQCFIQKFIALPSMKEAKPTVVIFTIGSILINVTSLLIGLIMYVHYKDNDPFTSGNIEKLDELLPYFVLDVARQIPGLCGLFIAGIVCAALSTLSAVLNSLTAAMFKDFVAPFLPEAISEKSVARILKLMVVLLGVFCTAIVYVIEHLGGLLSLQVSLNAVTLGPTLGLFTLGMLVPKANKKGAFYGLIVSVLLMCWMVFGAQYCHLTGRIDHPTKPLRSNNLTYYSIKPSNMTKLIDGAPTNEDVFFLYRISHYYYSPIGFVMMMAFGLLISAFTRNHTETTVDPILISPVSQRYVKKKLRMDEKYYAIGSALEKVIHAVEINDTTDSNQK